MHVGRVYVGIWSAISWPLDLVWVFLSLVALTFGLPLINFQQVSVKTFQVIFCWIVSCSEFSFFYAVFCVVSPYCVPYCVSCLCDYPMLPSCVPPATHCHLFPCVFPPFSCQIIFNPCEHFCSLPSGLSWPPLFWLSLFVCLLLEAFARLDHLPVHWTLSELDATELFFCLKSLSFISNSARVW